MSRQRREGPRPVPNDTELFEYFSDLISEKRQALEEVMDELSDTLKDTNRKGQPQEFAYGKLLNFLADQSSPMVIHLCAAALWRLNDFEGETDGT